MRVRALVGGMLLLAACSNPPVDGQPTAPPPSVNFQGFRIPGVAEDARQSGLAQCDEDSTYAAVCRGSGLKVFGVPAPTAAAWLSTPNTGEQGGAAPAARYDEIVFDYGSVATKQGCVGAVGKAPDVCSDTSALLVKVENEMTAQGWVFRQRDWGREYYKASEPVQVTIGAGASNGGKLILRKAELDDVTREIQAIAVANEARAAEAREQSRYVEQLNRRLN